MAMKYCDTKESSGEILRMALALMAKHNAAYHPTSYTLWYEYVAGCNAELKQALDEHLAAGKPLDDDTVEELVDKHVLDLGKAKVSRFFTEFQKLLEELSQSAQDTGQRTTAYESALNNSTLRLERSVDLASVKAIVEDLVAETRRMRYAVDDLEAQLAARSREVENLRSAVTQAQSESYIDPMTGITNRRGFDKIIKSMLTLGNQDPTDTCLLLVDIDHFKRINDVHGHLFGDKVIYTVAHALQRGVKGQDVVARFGGEEFIVLLPNTKIVGAQALAEQLRSLIERGKIRRGTELVGGVTVSIGVASHRSGETIDEVIQRADEALYASKQNGRNRVTVEGSISHAA
jgi:diguanylate cyclase